MATVRPGVLPVGAGAGGRGGRHRAAAARRAAGESPARRSTVISIRRRRVPRRSTRPTVAVGVGLGIGGPEALAVDRGAGGGARRRAIAATRDVVDAGWLPRQHQVGHHRSRDRAALLLRDRHSRRRRSTWSGVRRAGTDRRDRPQSEGADLRASRSRDRRRLGRGGPATHARARARAIIGSNTVPTPRGRARVTPCPSPSPRHLRRSHEGARHHGRRDHRRRAHRQSASGHSARACFEHARDRSRGSFGGPPGTPDNPGGWWILDEPELHSPPTCSSLISPAGGASDCRSFPTRPS